MTQPQFCAPGTVTIDSSRWLRRHAFPYIPMCVHTVQRASWRAIWSERLQQSGPRGPPSAGPRALPVVLAAGVAWDGAECSNGLRDTISLHASTAVFMLGMDVRAIILSLYCLASLHSH